MSSYDVSFSRHADADFDAISDFIARDNPYRAISFVDESQERTLRFLSTSPAAGSPLGKYRYIVFNRYVVVYSMLEAARQVGVLLVSEGHRDWRRLLADRS